MANTKCFQLDYEWRKCEICKKQFLAHSKKAKYCLKHRGYNSIQVPKAYIGTKELNKIRKQPRGYAEYWRTKKPDLWKKIGRLYYIHKKDIEKIPKPTEKKRIDYNTYCKIYDLDEEGLSQREIAKKVGFSQPAICEVLRLPDEQNKL